jgi:FkbM family methyltransferase
MTRVYSAFRMTNAHISRFIKTARFILQHPIGRRHRGATLARVARWQLASRLINAPIAVPWIPGISILAERGHAGVTGNIYVGLMEFEEMGFLAHVLRPGDLMVDVGANEGIYALLAASRGAHVIAFEPIPTTFERLRRNISLNSLENVESFMAGVAEVPGELWFSADRGCENQILEEPPSPEMGERAVYCRVETLDRVLNASPNLIKIDVEGSETRVLGGAANILCSEELYALIIEVSCEAEPPGASVFELLAEHGFSPMKYDPFARAIVDDPLGVSHGRNVLFVRDSAEIRRRLASSPSLEVIGETI